MKIAVCEDNEKDRETLCGQLENALERRGAEAVLETFSTAEELLDAEHPDFNQQVDPKCSWALAHPEFFPVEVNTADYEALLRVPGIGVLSARRILSARRTRKLRTESLRRLGVVMKRAQYFLTVDGKLPEGLRFSQDSLLRYLVAAERPQLPHMEQLSLFDPVG